MAAIWNDLLTRIQSTRRFCPYVSTTDKLLKQILTACYSDAENPLYVYDWRQQQEAAMRAAKGTGMSVDQVNNFVNGCKRCGDIHDSARTDTYRLPCI